MGTRTCTRRHGRWPTTESAFTAAVLLVCSAHAGAAYTTPPGAGVAAAEGTQAGDVELVALDPGVWLHRSWYTYPGGGRFSSNGLVVQDGDGLILVDTAWGEMATASLLTLVDDEIGLPIHRAVVTHFHADRAGGVDLLEARGIEVLAHPRTPELGSRLGIPAPDSGLAALGTPGTILAYGAFEVAFPGAGHAPDNLFVWFPERRLLFGGCALRAAAARGTGNLDDADLASWAAALVTIEAAYGAADRVVPGHGEPGGADLLGHTLALVRQELATASTDSAAAVRAIMEQSGRLSTAYVAGDIEGVVAVYAEDGIAVPAGRDFIQGHDALMELWRLPPGRTVLRHASTPVEIRVEGDMAWDRGYYEGRAAQDGEPLDPFRGTYLIVWERAADGVWRMAVDMWAGLRRP